MVLDEFASIEKNAIYQMYSEGLLLFVLSSTFSNKVRGQVRSSVSEANCLEEPRVAPSPALRTWKRGSLPRLSNAEYIIYDLERPFNGEKSIPRTGARGRYLFKRTILVQYPKPAFTTRQPTTAIEDPHPFGSTRFPMATKVDMDGDDRELQISLADGRVLILYKNYVRLPKSQVYPEESKHPLCWVSPCMGQRKRELQNNIPLQLILWAERQEQTISITFAEYTSPTELQPTIRTYTPAVRPSPEIDRWVATLIRRAYGAAQKQKRALVLINPHAGPGDAWKKWNKVQPLFKAARMELEMMATSQPGEAIEIARNLHIDRFDTVIAFSGDGLPHEIFNGLAERPDARRALSKIAVSQIPCGSGNAMACSLYGSHHASLAALGIIKGIDTAMDLASYTQGDRRRLSFLSQALGIIAEADLGTEHMRWMGAARFHTGVLTRILNKKAYPCDIDVKVELEDKTDIQLAFRAATGIPAVKAPTDDGWAVDTDAQGLPPLKYGTVQDPLPSDGWRRIKYDNMANFYCGKVREMSFLGVIF